MTRPRSDIQLLAIERQHQNLTNVLTPALRHLAAQLAQIDGYPGGTDTPKVSHTSELTPTEAAAEGRWHINAQVADLMAGVHLIVATYHDLVNTCHAILRGANTDAQPPRRCDANGRDGALEWGDFTCDALPVAHGLCSPCYQRERRWRVAHGLPTREAA